MFGWKLLRYPDSPTMVLVNLCDRWWKIILFGLAVGFCAIIVLLLNCFSEWTIKEVEGGNRALVYAAKRLREKEKEPEKEYWKIKREVFLEKELIITRKHLVPSYTSKCSFPFS